MKLFATAAARPGGYAVGRAYGLATWHLTTRADALRAICGRDARTKEGPRGPLCKMCVSIATPQEDS